MRFDDRLDTILRIDPVSTLGIAARWRQLADMLAQAGPELSEDAAMRALVALSQWRTQTPVEDRAGAAIAVASRCRFAPLASLLAADVAAVSQPFMDRLQLDPLGWRLLLPTIGPLGRSRLRQRRDLPDAVLRGLASFGPMDFALPAAAPVQPVALTEAATLSAIDDSSVVADPSEIVAAAAIATTDPDTAPTDVSDIASLVRRIEAYRQRQPSDGKAVAEATEAIAFRTDMDGHLRAVSGAPRGLFVGLTLAEPAPAAETGFDAGVARAFGKRAVIRTGRLFIADGADCGGHWLVDADPLFDRASGRFAGYHGTIRRPDAEAPVVINAIANEPEGLAIAPAHAAFEEQRPMADAMRQMVHELRSPLNAINGFAQLIQRQFFGPVSARYRELAGAIIADADLLAGAFEDIDIAARLDTASLQRGEGSSDIGALLGAGLASIAPVLEQRRAALTIHAPSQTMQVALPEADLHRIVNRLLVTIADMIDAEEVLTGRLMYDASRGTVTLAIESPTALAEGRNALAAAATGGHSGPLLGGAFTLTMIGQMAGLYGGGLQTLPNQLILNLPALKSDESLAGSA